MSPQTIRHIAVAVVASLGIVLLYLWPTSAKSPTGGPREAPVSTSAPSSAPTTSAASSPPPSSPGSSDSGAASPYNPHERVDTRSPQTNGSGSGEPSPDRSTSSPGSRASTPTPDRSSTPPPPPRSSTPTPPPTTTTTPTSPTTEPSSPETSDDPPAACTPPSGGPGTPTSSGSATSDPEAPNPPGAPVEDSRTDTTITIAWGPSDDAQHYRVYLNGELVCDGEALAATLEWTAPDEGTDTITVTAVDSAGNESSRSEPLEVGAQEEEGDDSQAPNGTKSPSREETP